MDFAKNLLLQAKSGLGAGSCFWPMLCATMCGFRMLQVMIILKKPWRVLKNI